MVKKKTVIVRESRNFWHFHLAHISRPITTKKDCFKIRLVSCENETLCWSDGRRLQTVVNMNS